MRYGSGFVDHVTPSSRETRNWNFEEKCWQIRVDGILCRSRRLIAKYSWPNFLLVFYPVLSINTLTATWSLVTGALELLTIIKIV